MKDKRLHPRGTGGPARRGRSAEMEQRIGRKESVEGPVADGLVKGEWKVMGRFEVARRTRPCTCL